MQRLHDHLRWRYSAFRTAPSIEGYVRRSAEYAVMDVWRRRRTRALPLELSALEPVPDDTRRATLRRPRTAAQRGVEQAAPVVVRRQGQRLGQPRRRVDERQEGRVVLHHRQPSADARHPRPRAHVRRPVERRVGAVGIAHRAAFDEAGGEGVVVAGEDGHGGMRTADCGAVALARGLARERCDAGPSRERRKRKK